MNQTYVIAFFVPILKAKADNINFFPKLLKQQKKAFAALSCS